MRHRSGIAWLAAAGVTLTVAAAAAEPTVDLALVLALDSSASVDAREFALQRGGLAAALRDDDVAQAIADGPLRRIAVTVVEWAGAAQQVVAVEWTVVGGQGDAAALAERIDRLERAIQTGATSIAGALSFGSALLRAAPFGASRRVIDLSGDGRNNQGQNVEDVRRVVLAQGITINGLAILNEHPTLNHYFKERVVGGDGAFVEVADDYESYVTAMRRKLLREIRSMIVSDSGPEPALALPESDARLASLPPPVR